MNMPKIILQSCLLVVMLLVFLVFMTGAVELKKAEAFTADEKNIEEIRIVPCAPVQELPNVSVREFPAKVRSGRRVQLPFAIAGLLIDLQALEGHIVKKGAIIARLDPRDNQNALNAAQARYAAMLLTFERMQGLRKSNVVPQADLDAAEANLAIVTAELRIREKALADTILTAPFDGVITGRFVENYEHIDDKKAIVAIQDISQLEIVVQLPEKIIAYGGLNSLRNVMVSFAAAEQREFTAKAIEFCPEADPVTRTYELVLAMEPPENLQIFPGMSAIVRAEVGLRQEQSLKNRTIVSQSAIVQKAGLEPYVWVINEELSAPQRVFVRLGAFYETGVEVFSDLLKPGQQVAVAGVNSLNEDMRVRNMRENAKGLGL